MQSISVLYPPSVATEIQAHKSGAGRALRHPVVQPVSTTGYSQEAASLQRYPNRYLLSAEQLEDRTLNAVPPESIGAHISAMPEVWENAARQIEKLAALKQGWDGENAPPPSRDAQRRLLRLLRFVTDGESVYPKIVTDFEGGLSAEWRAGAQSLAIEVDSLGEAYLYATDATGNRIQSDRVVLNQDSYPKISVFAAVLATLSRRVSVTNPSWRALFT